MSHTAPSFRTVCEYSMTFSSASILLTCGATGAEAPLRETTSADAFVKHGEWVERCRASLFAKDPSLDSADVLELANTLLERPGCRAVSPEVAVDRLFAGQLGSLR